MQLLASLIMALCTSNTLDNHVDSCLPTSLLRTLSYLRFCLICPSIRFCCDGRHQLVLDNLLLIHGR